MKIKLDENLPARLVEVLARHGHEADTVADEGLAGQDDQAVWQAAQAGSRFLITQDLDFSDVRRFQPGTHHGIGILLIRLREPGRNAILRRVADILECEEVGAWEGAFVVATERKVRVRRAPS